VQVFARAADNIQSCLHVLIMGYFIAVIQFVIVCVNAN